MLWSLENARTPRLSLLCSQVFTGAYLAAVDLVNFVFILFPICGCRLKSHVGECVAFCSCVRSPTLSSACSVPAPCRT